MKRKRIVHLILTAAILCALSVQAVIFFQAKQKSDLVIESIDHSDYKELKALLSQKPLLCNARIPDSGDTILNYAVEKGESNSVAIILAAGADPNLHGFSQRTALHIAVKGNRKDLVELLIKSGAHIENTGYRHNDTPLHVAVSNGFAKMVQFLLEHGALINSRNMQLKTPLILAVQNENISIVRLLLEHGANSKLVDQRERSALFFATKKNNQELIQLLNAKIDPRIE